MPSASPLPSPAALPRVASCSRRRALGRLLGFGGALALPLAGCGGGEGGGTGLLAGDATTATATRLASTPASSCSLIPGETAGANAAFGALRGSGAAPDVLTLPGIVRRDLRRSLGSTPGASNAPAPGVPMSLQLTLLNHGGGCLPLAGAAVYLWQCDAEGRYSLMPGGATQENWLRGVQLSGADGTLGFETVVPGCYAGRMPHLHLAVYPSLAAAGGGQAPLLVTQLALPTALLAGLYASQPAYGASATHLAAMSFAADPVFGDGYALQMLQMSSAPGGAYAASATVGVGAPSA